MGCLKHQSTLKKFKIKLYYKIQFSKSDVLAALFIAV